MGLLQKIRFWKRKPHGVPIVRKVFNQYAVYFSFPAAEGRPVGHAYVSDGVFSINKEDTVFCLTYSKANSGRLSQRSGADPVSDKEVIARFKGEADALEAIKAIEATLAGSFFRKVAKIAGIVILLWVVSTLGQFAKAVSSASTPQPVAQMPGQMFLPPVQTQPGLGLSGDGDGRYKGGLDGILDPNSPVVAGCGQSK